MKKSARIFFAGFMLLGILSLGSGLVWAGEHGGSTMQEHGGSTMQGNDDAATLSEAAALLKSSNPDLAKKLEKMAAKQCGI